VKIDGTLIRSATVLTFSSTSYPYHTGQACYHSKYSKLNTIWQLYLLTYC